MLKPGLYKVLVEGFQAQEALLDTTRWSPKLEYLDEVIFLIIILNSLMFQVLYEMDDSSPFLVGGGMAFQAGTTCTLAAANTPSHALLLLDRYADKTACYDLEYLAYSDYHSCIVHGKNGNLYVLK